MFHTEIIEGSDAIVSGDVISKPILIRESPLRPHEVIAQWLSTCTSHERCRRSYSNLLVDAEHPQTRWVDAPKRLIQLYNTRSGSKVLRPKLVTDIHVSNNGVPKYVSLSHCWGPPHKRPLRTTQTNLKQHMKAIPWDELPLTFSDAMKICVELDVEYIWIDSLCIIQDDEEDWKVESRKMGDIYENAYFTIAATSAGDSSQGLFGNRQALDMTRVPYESAEGVKSQVFAYIEPEVVKEMVLSPLGQRAWVLQEYLLSRRIVHFTMHGLVWTCKYQERFTARHVTSEFGEVWAVAFEDTWTPLVESYTRRQLTFNTDKLVAIAGLSQKYEEKWPGRSYRQGLWLEDMPHDLLWFSNERLARDATSQANIPSWSWASTTGPISFKSAEFDEVENLCHRIQCSETTKDQLIINTTLKPVDDLRGPLQCQGFCYEDLQDMDFNGRLHDDYKDGSISPSPTFLLLSGGEKVGWAVFDDFERPSQPIYCLGLLRQKIWEWFAVSKEDHFIWVLLLRKQSRSYGGETEEFFNRVGWGLVLVPSWLEHEEPHDVLLM